MQLPNLEGLNSLLGTVSGCLNNVSVIKGLFTGKQEPQEINSMQLQLVEAIGEIIQAQKDHMTLLQENTELKQSLKEKDQWDSERKRYKLYQAGSGDLVYLLQQTEATDEPVHAICTQCYEEGKKSILKHGFSRGVGTLECHKCGKTARMGRAEKFLRGLSSIPPTLMPNNITTLN